MRRGRPLHVGVMLVAVLCAWTLASTGVARGQPRPGENDRAAPGRAGWLVDSRTGCRVWRQFPRPGDVVSWTGACGSDGRATGYGVAEWRAGDAIDRHEGEFVAGKPHGHGVYLQAGGSRYEGDFDHGVPHGVGVYTDAGGGEYKGDVRAGAPDGRGVLVWSDGAQYDGEFQDGRRQGRGVLTWPDGRRYEGEFAESQPHGRGTYTDPTGKRYEGHFEHGHWIGDDWDAAAKQAQKAGEEGRYADAEGLWRAAIRSAEEPGSDWTRLVVALRGLSEVYSEQARHAEAESLLRRNLALCEKNLATDAVDRKGCLVPLAFNQIEQQRPVEAESLLTRALAIVEQELGPEHVDVALILHGRAAAYRLAARYREAEADQRRSLAIRERALGTDHYLFGQSLNNLALVYTAQQRYAEAEPLFQQSLAIWDKALGSEHAWSATVRANLGELLVNVNRSREAEPLLKRSLEIRERVLLPGDPAVVTGLMLLGWLYFDEGHYADAAALIERAVALRERHLGAEHPDVAGSLAELARVVRAQGRPQDADVFSQRALAIIEKDQSREHGASDTLYLLAETALAQAKTSEADDLLRRAATIRRAHGETTAGAVLQLLAQRHIARPDPARLAEAALAEVQRTLRSLGIHDMSGTASGPDPSLDLKAGLERAVELAHGRLDRAMLELAATQAMVRILGDPHTGVLAPDTARLLAAGLRGYVGIGVEPVTAEGRDHIWLAIPTGPAARGGVQSFDRVLSISGASMTGLLTREARLTLGQRVALTVQSPNAEQPRTVTILSDLVSVPTVDHRFARPGIGYIAIHHFGEGAGDAMRDAIEVLRRQGLTGLIVDLRHNPGGLTRELMPVAETVLPGGTLLEELVTRHGRGARVTRVAPVLPTSTPLAVLVDKSTGSTAEVLAAAIQAAGRGIIVGSQTSGAVAEKQVFWLPGGAALVVQTSRVLDPRGLALDGVGVIPDVVHPLVADDLDRGVDSQLERAIQEVAASLERHDGRSRR